MTEPQKPIIAIIEGNKIAVCCSAFEEATHGGTDNEGWGTLVSFRGQGGRDLATDFDIGYHLPPIKFCPWCGASVETFRFPRTL